MTTARPSQAAITSAGTFLVGAALPLAMVLASPPGLVLTTVPLAALRFLALLGAAGAYAGRAPPLRATMRVTLWGALAMALMAGIGALVGTAARPGPDSKTPRGPFRFRAAF